MGLTEELKEIKDNCKEHTTELNKRLQHGSEKFIVIDGEVAALQRWQKLQNGTLQQLAVKIELNNTMLQEMKLDLATGKPSWALVVFITLLSNITVALAVFILKGGMG
jgi:hypothetical protein